MGLSVRVLIATWVFPTSHSARDLCIKSSPEHSRGSKRPKCSQDQSRSSQKQIRYGWGHPLGVGAAFSFGRFRFFCSVETGVCLTLPFCRFHLLPSGLHLYNCPLAFGLGRFSFFCRNAWGPLDEGILKKISFFENHTLYLDLDLVSFMSNPEGGNQVLSILICGRHVFGVFTSSY